jgi:hypothetical protein
MLARLAYLFDLPADWQPWVAPMIGLTSAGLTLGVGWTLIRRWRSRQRAAPEAGTPGKGRPERRKSPRRGGPAVKVLLCDADGETKPYTAMLLDRSLGGMRLAVAEAIPVGTRLSVCSSKATGSDSWLRMEVKYCFWQDKSWLVGCKFAGTPSWSALMLFE